MDGVVDPTVAGQGRVGGFDDRVHRQPGDVAIGHFDAHGPLYGDASRYAAPVFVVREAPMNVSREQSQAIFEALMRGDKMTAIKLVREATGNDLKAAMGIVQQIASQIQATKGQSGGVQHSGPHDTPETSGQRENRARTEAFMAKSHPPTVQPGDRGGMGLAVWLVILACAGFVWWMIEG